MTEAVQEPLFPGIEKSKRGIGSSLRRLREELGLSINALARHTGISPSAISKLESEGNRLPNRNTLALIIRAISKESGLSEEKISEYFEKELGPYERERVREALSLVQFYKKLFSD